MGPFAVSLDQAGSRFVRLVRDVAPGGAHLADAHSGGAQSSTPVAFSTEHIQVAILLSTYQGEPYLPEQLASLSDQTHQDWILYWRDDGSSDRSVAIMESFAAGEGKGRCIRVPDTFVPRHRGIAGSFLSLLRAVAGLAQVVAFADQDDFWLPDKIERGLAALGMPDNRQPALYYARQRLVDRALKPLGLSPPLHRLPEFPASLTQNVATGCTMMLNPAAARLIANSTPPDGTLHDWWSYLLVDAAGGRLIADPAAVVLYRQHRENAVGAPHSLLRRGLMALQRGPDAFMSLFRTHVASLSAQAESLSPRARADLMLIVAALAGGVWARLRAMRSLPQLTRRTALETLLFRLWFLIG